MWTAPPIQSALHGWPPPHLHTDLRWRQHDGAECPGVLDGGDQKRRDHARWRIYPFAVREVFELVGLAHVDDALAVKAGRRLRRIDYQCRGCCPRVVDRIGFVDNQSQIDRAMEVARSIEGVRSVSNEMSIKK